jgi:hypothetical protein
MADYEVTIKLEDATNRQDIWLSICEVAHFTQDPLSTATYKAIYRKPHNQGLIDLKSDLCERIWRANKGYCGIEITVQEVHRYTYKSTKADFENMQ